MSRQIILWRHGRTAWNVAGRVQGQTDTSLDDVGREQAAAAARRLASLAPHRILCSDLERARHTAEALAELVGVPAEPDPRLREMDFGAREGLTWQEAWDRYPDGMRAWMEGDETQIPDSETHAQAGERFAAGVREALEVLPADATMVVVAHGAVIRTGACTFLGFPEEHWRTFGALSNCSWAVLTESGPPHQRWWRLTEWNAGSLPEPVMSDDS
ncbi:phosphoglycerate mutase family protein [Aeromicrobium marinum DSM 15272]|uniref:Phosphoglycerate mutase family protein n=1 Tax=Aeromicrobium marinum DSM 15272 TaxID=585531 RepID=E2SB71_9ACTN|nr:histidine phosphatase family protein [Aeromicrobium marinum]EFQ83617.1 phosphoglycerate mutase family protein [Aeromicrobium marinum DSM 15272]